MANHPNRSKAVEKILARMAAGDLITVNLMWGCKVKIGRDTLRYDTYEKVKATGKVERSDKSSWREAVYCLKSA